MREIKGEAAKFADYLRETADKMEAGEIVAMACVTVDKKGVAFNDRIISFDDSFRLVGAMEFHKHMIIDRARRK